MALMEARVELIAIELREGAELRKHMVVLAMVAAIFLALSLLLLAFGVVVFFWDSQRMAAIFGVTFVYAGIGAWAYLRFQDVARSSPPPFSATLAEFEKDLDLLRGRDEPD
jgi:uncharacterized membrane protein YqjE